MDTQRQQLKEYLSKVPNPTSLTLTLKYSSDGVIVDEIVVSRNIRHFINVLHQRIFGKRYTRFKSVKLKIVPIVEQNKRNRFHTHITLEKPTHLTNTEFYSHLRESWKKTKYGDEHIHLQSTYNIDGWTDYILKERTKLSSVVDSVDWDNVNI